MSAEPPPRREPSLYRRLLLVGEQRSDPDPVSVVVAQGPKGRRRLYHRPGLRPAQPLLRAGQGGLLSLVAQAQPDLIVITGDIIDRNRTDLGPPCLPLPPGPPGLAPTWYVTGYHEFSVEEGTRQTLFQGLAQAGVHLLDDNWQLELPGGAPLLLAGVSDTALRAGDVQNVLAAARAESGLEKALTLLLAHEPQYLQSYAAAGADLVFCGHAHGGQIRLPAVGGLFAPGQGPLSEYTAGLYQAEETTMLVSRGLGNSVFPLRVFNRPEITALTLRAEGA